MDLVVIGLIGSVALYMLAIYGFIWSGRQLIRVAHRGGVVLGPEPKNPSLGEVWKRHGKDSTVIFSIFFFALALTDFGLLQRLGIAGAIALVFGSLWISNSPHKPASVVHSRMSKITAATGYWVLAVVDWFGYLSVICFATALLAKVVQG